VRVNARACVWVRNRDQGNILGEYFKFARTVRVLVPMHRVAPHYCIVALECLISCLRAPDKARYYTVKRWSTYNSELFIFVDATDRRCTLRGILKFYVPKDARHDRYTRYFGQEMCRREIVFRNQESIKFFQRRISRWLATNECDRRMHRRLNDGIKEETKSRRRKNLLGDSLS